MAGAWASWDAFADHHGLDPDRPTDEALVAFVMARFQVGVAWGTLDATLAAVRLATEGTASLTPGSRTLPAVRFLNDLYRAGGFDPSWQAPLVTVGQVLAMVAASDPVWAFVVGVTYAGGMRASEWSPVDLEHLQVGPGGLLMLLPRTKTQDWQKVRIAPLPDSPIDPATLAARMLEVRGTGPGPLLGDRDGHRLSPETIKGRLRAAARTAGVMEFSPHSLRRSMAVHADLLGVSGQVIRQRLRHAPESGTYRRYIEPLLALMDRPAAAGYYLSARRTPSDPPLIRRARQRAPYAVKYGFAAGTIPDLLEGISMPDLRVPLGLVGISREGIAKGRRILHSWADFARSRGWDPLDPPAHGLPLWLLRLLDEMKAVSAAGTLNDLRIGWLDATGSEHMPGWDVAVAAAAGAVRAEAPLSDPRHKSRMADASDVQAICEAAADAVPEPTRRWAVTVLTWLSKATKTLAVTEVATRQVTVRVDGARTIRLSGRDCGVLDPVTAALVLGRNRPATAVPGASRASAVAAGAPRSLALRNRLAVVLLAGSGARPSDLERARSQGVELTPGGLAIVLGVAKGKPRQGLGRARIIWAPHRPGASDPIAAWTEWAEWWPIPARGPLLPAVVDRINAEKAMSAATVSATITRAAKRAGIAEGLTAYGFRYGRATEMHRAGETDETIAEALGHDDLDVTRGYIVDFDPFADGRDDDFIRSLT